MHSRGLTDFSFAERSAGNFRNPDCDRDCGNETNTQECPVLPAMSDYFAARRGCYGGFAGGPDVDVKKSAGHHTDPARQHVRPEFHSSEPVKIIAEVERDDRTES